jgi:septum formation protein
MQKIILASNSPRRIKILKLLGLRFSVFPSRIREGKITNSNLRQAAKAIALAKARKVADKFPRDVIIAADTIVDFQGRRLGKPKNKQQAKEYLRLLRNKTNRVHTALAMINTLTGLEEVAVESAEIKMRNYSDKEIAEYVANREPLDKAGAYAIQGSGGALIKKVKGDRYAVIGLPVKQLAVMLKKSGLKLPATVISPGYLRRLERKISQ